MRKETSWSWIFLSLVLGFGITLFFLAMLVAAASSGAWKLTIWTNTIGEGWPEIVLFCGVSGLQAIGLVFYCRNDLATEKTRKSLRKTTQPGTKDKIASSQPSPLSPEGEG